MKLPTGYSWDIRKNKDGTIRKRIRARIYKVDSYKKRRRVAVYGENLDDVKVKVREVQNRQITSFDSGKETLSAYLDRWLRNVQSENAPRTHELYSLIVNKHITSYIGSIRLGKLLPRDIGDLINDTLKHLGSRTRQLVYRVLHCALDKAVADDLIVLNPCRKNFQPKHEYAKFRSLTKEEAARLLETAKSGDRYVLLYLALATGMRQGELFGLRWEAVDFEHGFLSVCATLTRDSEGKPVLRPPKGKQQRRIDISPYVCKLLKEHKRTQYPLSPWVFSDTNGSPTRKDNFGYRVFRPLVKKAKIEKLRFHDLRHSSATLGLAAGENIKVVQERLGHSSAKMTLDVYAKAVPTLQREAAIRMDSILSLTGLRQGPRERSSDKKTLQRL